MSTSQGLDITFSITTSGSGIMALGIQPRASHVLGMHSTSLVTFLPGYPAVHLNKFDLSLGQF